MPGSARSEEELRALLHRLDGRGYKAYRDLRGRYRVGAALVFVDHVQGDPFAAPSRLRARIPRAETGLPADLDASPVRRVALADALARRVARAARTRSERRGSGKSGRIEIDAGAQPVLERTAVRVEDDFVEARIQVGLPAAGRRILGREACALLADDVPAASLVGCCVPEDELAEVRTHVDTVENHAALRAQLAEHGLVAFVADGSVLPRASGADDRPLAQGAVPFRAPDELAVELALPNPVDGRARVRGLGIRRGVTLVVGGGYHGKSTLLRAIERGVMAHVPGDGRERVASLASAVKIRAEDGRRVTGCDVHAFIGELPFGRDTRAFETDDASGSTSQAANIVEALEAGADVLLVDEDTSATNFMVRDARMQQLVAREHEPITPFIDRVRELHERLAVSTVLVMGGVGDYLGVADTVIEMVAYEARDVTTEAKRIAASGGERAAEARGELERPPARVPDPASVDPSRGRRDVKIDVRGTASLGFGTENVDLRALEQLVDPSQVRAIGHALVWAREHAMGRGVDLPTVLDRIEAAVDEDGLEILGPRGANLARPRRYEIAGALNRLRSLRLL